MTKQELEDKLFHAGHDLVLAKSLARNIRQHAILLLNDAVDAIEIERPDVAIQRIKMALKALTDDKFLRRS